MARPLLKDSLDTHFPDLFEWILSTINELPMPRRSSKAHQTNPLHVELFPA
ncbi:hypothetical protein Lepto7375DRAFT_4228 [Leptolyngbya sp. PCC 7375]|nr:hypothetical protein Lepto7375DRAFT_4228 [Leptolyngbya sp. PCC 7375]